MKAQTLYEFLCHFSSVELEKTEIEVAGDNKEKNLSVKKLSIECTEERAYVNSFNENLKSISC